MIIKKIPARTVLNADRVYNYITDAKDAAPGEAYGPKVDSDYCMGFGFLSDKLPEQKEEIKMLAGSYVGTSDPLQHWSMSWPPGEHPTPAQFKECWQQFLTDQGMEGFQLIVTAHIDQDHFHGHALLNRINPEPDASGAYRLEWSSGRIASIQKKSGERHTNQALCAQATAVEMSVRQGWQLLENRRFDYSPETGLVKRSSGNPEKISLGSRVETWEALHQGEKHPKRILAEKAVEILRASDNDKTLAVTALAAAGIAYKDEDYLDNKGRHHKGGVVSIGKEKVKISALPKSDRWIADMPAIPAVAVDTAAGQLLLSSEKQKVKSTPNAEIVHDSQEKVNEKSFETALNPGRGAINTSAPADIDVFSEIFGGSTKTAHEDSFSGDFSAGTTFANSSPEKMSWSEKQEAKAALVADAAPLFAEYAKSGRTAVENSLAGQGIALVEATRTITNEDGSEKTIVYGQLERNGISAPLSALGKTEDGKAIHTLGTLNRAELQVRREALIADALPVVQANAEQGRSGVAGALEASGMALVEATSTIKDEKTGEEKEIKFGKIERDGISVSLSALGKTEEGKALYSLGSLEFTERKNRQEQLRAEALPVIEAHAAEGWRSVTEALAASNIKLSEEATVIKDKETGAEKEITYARLEREGISVSLKSLGEGENGRALFRARELQQQQLANDFAAIAKASSTWAETEKKCSEAEISYSRVKITVNEKTFTVGRLERDGITTTTTKAGDDYRIGALDARFMPYDNARSLYLQAAKEAAPVQFLANQGLTASDIDRIGRVGERIEQSRKPIEAKDTPHAQAKASGKAVIPTSIEQILDEILDAANNAAAVARASAAQNKAIHQANQARKEAEAAKQALAELRNSIQHEQPKQQPQTTPEPKLEPLEPVQKEDTPMTMNDENNTAAAETAKIVVPDDTLRNEEIAALERANREYLLAQERAEQEKALEIERERERQRDLDRMRERERELEIEREREREREREIERERQ